MTGVVALGIGPLPRPTVRGANVDPPLVAAYCSRCRHEVQRNSVLRISWCPLHGLHVPFTFAFPSRTRLPGA